MGRPEVGGRKESSETCTGLPSRPGLAVRGCKRKGHSLVPSKKKEGDEGGGMGGEGGTKGREGGRGETTQTRDPAG